MECCFGAARVEQVIDDRIERASPLIPSPSPPRRERAPLALAAGERGARMKWRDHTERGNGISSRRRVHRPSRVRSIAPTQLPRLSVHFGGSVQRTGQSASVGETEVVWPTGPARKWSIEWH